MKRASHEHAVFLGGDLALPSDPNAARVSDDLADHVLGGVRPRGRGVQVGHVRLAPADGPLGDVIGPDVGGHASGGLAVTAVKSVLPYKVSVSIYTYRTIMTAKRDF